MTATETETVRFWVADEPTLYEASRVALAPDLGRGRGIKVVRRGEDRVEQALLEVTINGRETFLRQIDGDLDFGPVADADGKILRTYSQASVYDRLWGLVLA